jgi:energy-coupling factor transporter ATP-binding protein EcfA2
LIPKGRTIWITGLSGAGKSTLAVEVTGRLRALGQAVVTLDGDELREVFGAATANAQNHSREGRLALAMQYARLCRVIANQGPTVVIATAVRTPPLIAPALSDHSRHSRTRRPLSQKRFKLTTPISAHIVDLTKPRPKYIMIHSHRVFARQSLSELGPPI